jgi:hypothetical protein
MTKFDFASFDWCRQWEQTFRDIAGLLNYKILRRLASAF